MNDKGTQKPKEAASSGPNAFQQCSRRTGEFSKLSQKRYWVSNTEAGVTVSLNLRKTNINFLN